MLRRQPQSIIFCAFDLMHLDGNGLRQQTLSERRGRLRALIGTIDAESRIRFSEEFDGGGDVAFGLGEMFEENGARLSMPGRYRGLASASVGRPILADFQVAACTNPFCRMHDTYSGSALYLRRQRWAHLSLVI